MWMSTLEDTMYIDDTEEFAFHEDEVWEEEPEFWDGQIWYSDDDAEFMVGADPCHPGEGPPAPVPDPEGRGLHPLILRGTSRRRSRNPTVGDAQRLLNEFLSRYDAGRHTCVSGAPASELNRLRAATGSVPIAVDCRFGPITEAVTKLFQACTFADRRQWDGKIGPVTWPPLELMRTALPPTPTVPPPTPLPTVPVDIQAIIEAARRFLDRLPLGRIGIRLPTAVRFLTSGEQTLADTVYNRSIDYSRVLISDGLGAEGRAFTTYVPSSAGDFIVMNMGEDPFKTPLYNKGLLIHELAHAWQSQHHPSSPTAFMVNSALSQTAAIADMPVAKAAAAARATAVAIRSGFVDPRRLATIANSASAAEDTSAYAYMPGRRFGQYGAEQIAEQVEHSFTGSGRPTPAVIAHIRSLSPHAPSRLNETSLATPRWERKSMPGVIF